MRVVMSPALLALLAVGCDNKVDTGGPFVGTNSTSSETAGPDSALDTGDSAPPPFDGVWYGAVDDEGFGTALAGDSAALYAGAPGSDRAYLLGPGGEVSVALEGDGRLGSALALDVDGSLWAGAPLRGGGGALVSDGSSVEGDAGDVLGGRLILAGEALAATTTSGATVAGLTVALGARPGGLAWLDGALAVGTPWAPDALTWGDRALPRPGERDEAGYALCASDLDGDGAEDLAVGAPATGVVYLLLGEPSDWDLTTAPALRGEGRFGHALTCRDGALHVGAPAWGDESEGAVFSFTGGVGGWSVGAPDYLGEGPQDSLGWSLLLIGEALYAGAPGGAHSAGRAVHLNRG